MSDIRRKCDIPNCESLAQEENVYRFAENGKYHERYLCDICFSWIIRGWYKYPNGTKSSYVINTEAFQKIHDTIIEKQIELFEDVLDS